MASWPSLKEVRSLLRMQPNAEEDGVIDRARLAAIAKCNHEVGDKWPPAADPVIPDDVHFAAMLLASRYYRRRDSLDGTIGWGGLGVVRVGRTDPDVAALLGPYMPPVFA